MECVVLAAGEGKRMRPLTAKRPKVMLPLSNRPMMEHLVLAARDAGIRDFVFIVGYGEREIRKHFDDGSSWGVHIAYASQRHQQGTANAVGAARELVSGPFLVMNGDILTSMNYGKLFDFALNIDSDLTVTIKEIITPFQFGNIFYDGDFVTGIQEKPNIRTEILAGIYIYKPKIFQIIPENELFSMDHLINKMIDLKMPIAKYEMHEYWLDIGSEEDYKKAQEVYKNNFTIVEDNE